jgi:hypothetical protein
MAFVVRRTTKAGSLSTALVESYRDEQGRPRHRLLANLHGEPDPLRALAKLVVMHDALSEQRWEEHAEPSGSGAGFVLVTERALTKHNHRIVQIDRQLAVIERDMAAVNKHCTASDDELQDAIQAHMQKFTDTFHEVAGRGSAYRQQLKAAKARLRRLST